MRSYGSPFATRLREIVYTSKYTFQGIADHIGVCGLTVRKWKDGETVPTIEQFEKMADYLGVSCDYLLGRTK